MTRLLVDTPALIWLVEDDPKLSSRAVASIEDDGSRCFCSVASVWEMGIKIALGKLHLTRGTLDDFVRLLQAHRVGLLPILALEAADVAELPLGRHQDPFDRLIAAQCLRYDLTLVSVDPHFDAYGVRRVW